MRNRPASTVLRRRWLLTAAAVVTLASAPLVTSPQPALAATSVPLRVLPLGDSITAGVGSSTGSSYRGRLWDLLTGAGTTVDFVGSLRFGTLPDIDNEGHSGWRIDAIQGIASCKASIYRPNVVTLHLGTNDMNQNFQVSTASARLGALVDQILTVAPDTTVLVSNLVPSRNPDVQARIAAFNPQIPGVVAQRRSAGKHVAFVDMAAVTTSDLADDLHPNDVGYAKMAQAFDAGIRQADAAGWLRAPVPQNPGACPGGWGDEGNVAGGVGAPAGQVRFADVDGDSKADYLVLADNGSLRAWLNKGGDGAGGWTDRGTVAGGTGAPAARVRLADVDGDRKADYLVVADDGSVHVWLNTGGDGAGGWVDRGTFAGATGVPLGQVSFADFDGDGRADYLALADNGALRVWLNKGGDGSGGWVGRGQVAGGTGSPAGSVRLADFDGDHRVDYLVLADNGVLRVWLNRGGDGNGGWVDRGVASAAFASGSQVRFADLDGDGRGDYVILADNGAVHLWLNRGGDG